MKDISGYGIYIGLPVKGGDADNDIATDFFVENDKIFCVINDNYECEFSHILIDFINGGDFVVVK